MAKTLPRVRFESLSVGDLVDWDDWPQRMRRCRVVALNDAQQQVLIATVATTSDRQRPFKQLWVDTSRLYDPGVVQEY